MYVHMCQCPTQHDEDEEASLADVVEDRGAAGQPVVHVQEVTQWHDEHLGHSYNRRPVNL